VGPLTPPQQELLHAGREDCERLQTIVDELLDVSRLEAGRLTLRRGTVDVARVVADAVDAQRIPAAARSVTLETQVLPGVGTLDADPERLEIVLSNLLVNAVRHSPAGGVVTLRAQEVDGDVVFDVEDQGVGIPAEYHHAIFEKFFQIPGQTGGAGLGLFIAKEIVDAHGGRMKVESQTGKGSTFSVRIGRGGAAQM
jgi:signal transduction histidine kinase